MRALRQSNRHSHRCCFQLSWRLKFPVYWCHFRPGRHRRHSNWGCPFQPLHCRPRCSNSAIRRPPNPPGATSNGSGRRSAANAGTAHPCRAHSGANCATTAAATAGQRKSNGQCGYQQRKSQTSRIANDHGALLSVDPQTMWGGLLTYTGHQQKVTALDNFRTSRKADRPPAGCRATDAREECWHDPRRQSGRHRSVAMVLRLLFGVASEGVRVRHRGHVRRAGRTPRLSTAAL